MANDLATALAEPGGAAADVVLDGVDLRAFVTDLSFQDCPYDGVVLERKELIMLQGVIVKPVPLSQVLMDGTRYMVESSIEPYPALEIILTRFAS